MKVPLSDPLREYHLLRDEFDAAYRRVMESGYYIMGREHDQFETELAAYCGVPHCIAVASGTDALELALKATGCGPGSEVITVANAGAYTTLSAIEVGATPVFADIDAETLTISPSSVAAALSDRTRAVVVTHLYGKLADVEGVRAAVGPDVAIVEDCAQAHGAARGGRRAGSFGDVATFSFYPTKNLGAFGDGGALVTNRDDIAASLRLLRQYGWNRRYHVSVTGGRNSRLDELQAAFLRIKLAALDRMNERRRAVAARCRDAAAGTAIDVVHAPGEDFVAHLLIARHPDRAAVMARLGERGVATSIHYPVADHEQQALAGVQWRTPGLPNTEAAQREIFTLPCFAGMRDDEVDYVCEALAAEA